MHKTKITVLAMLTTISLLTPISLVLADDTEPPVITDITYGPHAGVWTDPGFYMFQSCNVTDNNISVADVRVSVTGPAGFTPINASMVNTGGNQYYYQINNVSLSGTYAFYIWAIDTSGNAARSSTYYMLVFDSYFNYVYVDVNNVAGPWYGTAQHPLQYIADAVAVIAPNGTIFVYEGIYANTSLVLNKSMTILGENLHTTILEGGGSSTSVVLQIHDTSFVSLSDLTVRSAMVGIEAQNSSNSILSQCNVSQCLDAGIKLVGSSYFLVHDCNLLNNNKAILLINCSNNQFYHNNFMENTVHVSVYPNTYSNTWDNGTTGNYWDNYRLLYPSANVIPGTGTWDTPYLVNASGNNIDYHPWVYPSGYIDTVPPEVTVIYPNGGEVVSGEITIQWYASDDLTMNLDGTIILEYSADNGGSWVQLVSHGNNTGFYVWNTTSVPDGDFYLISVSAIDDFYNIGSDASDRTFSISNYATEYPQINGPTYGGNGIVFNFTAVYTDPDEKNIFYKWDWGDGNESEWFGPLSSGEPISASKMWINDGNYSIRVKAKNVDGIETQWSDAHLMIIAEQINFSNVKLGHIYFKLFSFNRSFIFSDFLKRLYVVIILTSHEMELEAFATDAVKSVTFKAMNQMQIEDMEVTDDDGSNGFSCTMNVTRGVYQLNITAFDGNGTLIDRYSLASVFFIRIGRYATGAPENRLQTAFIIRPRLRP
ncbi:MAG: hypothetical protein BV458_13695 [Thermoplasmata archaeon M9B2D]|nr:MAG: hypothetical protein BV458_13695 [Thermoplasmata archaeon M9B2D]